MSEAWNCETPFMLAFVVLILYAIVIGIIAIGIFCFCCIWWVYCCEGFCVDEENENTNAETNTSAQRFRRSLSNTSQRAQLTRAVDAWRKPTTARNSSSINPPTTEIPERPLSNQNYSPEVEVNLLPSAPPPPSLELQELPPAELPPPSYEEVMNA